MLSWPLRRETHYDGDKLASAAILVGHVKEPGEAVAGLLERCSLTVRFGRCVRDEEQFALSGNSVIKNGDIVTVVGLASDVYNATQILGDEYDGEVLSDRSQLGLPADIRIESRCIWQNIAAGGNVSQVRSYRNQNQARRQGFYTHC